MTEITAKNITVDIPVLSLRARSLRTVLMQKTKQVGGQVVRSGHSVAIVRALNDISFSLKKGDRLALIGHNGAGKTTLLRVLADIYTPTSGSLKREGQLVPMFDIGMGFDTESTGYENINLRGAMMGLSKQEVADRRTEIAEFSELGDYLDMPIRTYSQGMLLRLMFSIATSVEGDIILMDEWISVGDKAFQEKAQERMLRITGDAGILVLASHDEGTLRRHCNLFLKLDHGTVAAFGRIEDL